MAWELTHDIAAFHAAANGYLAADPVHNTLLLTATEAARQQGLHTCGDDGSARFGWWRSDETVAGAFVYRPRRLLLGPMPTPAARELVQEWRTSGMTVATVDGWVPTIRTVTDRWTAAGGTWRVRREQRAYQLDELTWPQPHPGGAARVAGAADVPLVERWLQEFAEAVGEDSGAPQQVMHRVKAGRVLLWETAGVPVSMAGFSAIVAGQGRVTPVYTPPELRGRSYAGAVTCAASEAARMAGARWVLLFADLANPTSNALYQRLGYRPVGDSHVVDLRD